MRTYDNGVYRDMTHEEEAAWNQAAQEQPEITQPVEYVTYEALAQAIREGVNSVE